MPHQQEEDGTGDKKKNPGLKQSEEEHSTSDKPPKECGSTKRAHAPARPKTLQELQVMMPVPLYQPQLWLSLLKLRYQNIDKSLHRDTPEGINSNVHVSKHVPVPLRSRDLPIHRRLDTRAVLHLFGPMFSPALSKVLQVHHLLRMGRGGIRRGGIRRRGAGELKERGDLKEEEGI